MKHTAAGKFAAQPSRTCYGHDKNVEQSSSRIYSSSAALMRSLMYYTGFCQKFCHGKAPLQQQAGGD